MDEVEYRLTELSRISGVSSRNIRAYRERGLLDPPRRQGRSAFYNAFHLAQLDMINQLLRRGFSSAHIAEFFASRVFPILTPLAVDPAHPFPYISGLSLNLAVVVRHPETGTEHRAEKSAKATEQHHHHQLAGHGPVQQVGARRVPPRPQDKAPALSGPPVGRA